MKPPKFSIRIITWFESKAKQTIAQVKSVVANPSTKMQQVKRIFNIIHGNQSTFNYKKWGNSKPESLLFTGFKKSRHQNSWIKFFVGCSAWKGDYISTGQSGFTAEYYQNTPWTQLPCRMREYPYGCVVHIFKLPTELLCSKQELIYT